MLIKDASHAQRKIKLTFSLSLSVSLLPSLSLAGFEYVVNPPVAAKVAFGSTMHRDVMPISGPAMSSYMRSLQTELREFPGPLDYDCAKPIGFKVSQATIFADSSAPFGIYCIR